MKKLFYLIFLLNIKALLFAEKVEDNVTTILVLGLDKGDIQSNYYMIEDIAKGIHTSPDSVEIIYNEAIVDKLNTSEKSNFEFITIDESKIDKNDLNKLFSNFNADYILSFEKYELNWKGEPYYILFNVINYNLYNRKSEAITSGQSYFDTPELQPLSQMDRKFQKMADRIALQTTKVLK
jgi:hypothetical protein